MGQQLLLYGQALLANWFYVVTGGVPLLLDQLLQFGSERWRKWVETKGPWRRRLEIGFLLGAAVWAGFQAWSDQYAATQRMAAGRDSAINARNAALGARAYWFEVAAERDGAINGSNGYKDQMRALQSLLAVAQSKPPQIIDRDHFIPASPPLPLKVEVDNSGVIMRPSDDQIEALAQVIAPIAKQQSGISVYWTGGDEERRIAVRYIKALKRAGFTPSAPIPIQSQETEVGVMVGVGDPTKPSDTAQKFLTAIRTIVPDAHFTAWGMPTSVGAFDLYIGPDASQ